MNEDESKDDEEAIGTEVGEQLDDNKDSEEYKAKMKEMRSYLPLLRVLISSYRKGREGTQHLCINKLESLHNIISSPSKKLRMRVLVKCKKILEGLSKKIKILKLDVGPYESEESDSMPLSPISNASLPPCSSSSTKSHNDLDDDNETPDAKNVPLGRRPPRKHSSFRSDGEGSHGQPRWSGPCDPALLQSPTSSGWNRQHGPRGDYRSVRPIRPDSRMTRHDNRMIRPDSHMTRHDNRMIRPGHQIERPRHQMNRPDQTMVRPEGPQSSSFNSLKIRPSNSKKYTHERSPREGGRSHTESRETMVGRPPKEGGRSPLEAWETTVGRPPKEGGRSPLEAWETTVGRSPKEEGRSPLEAWETTVGRPPKEGGRSPLEAWETTVGSPPKEGGRSPLEAWETTVGRPPKEGGRSPLEAWETTVGRPPKEGGRSPLEAWETTVGRPSREGGRSQPEWRETTVSRRVYREKSPTKPHSATKASFFQDVASRQASSSELPSRFNIGRSLSTSLKIDGSDPFKDDEDRLILEEKSRNIEKLMENRFASMHAKKLTSSMINDSIRKINVPNTCDKTDSPLSSTLDEMMSNLTAKFGGARGQANTKQSMKKDVLLPESVDSSNFTAEMGVSQGHVNTDHILKKEPLLQYSDETRTKFSDENSASRSESSQTLDKNALVQVTDELSEKKVEKFLFSMHSGTSLNSTQDISSQSKSDDIYYDPEASSSSSTSSVSPNYLQDILSSLSMTINQQNLNKTQSKPSFVETLPNITNSNNVALPSKTQIMESNISVDTQSVKVPFLESDDEFIHSKSNAISNDTAGSNETQSCEGINSEIIETQHQLTYNASQPVCSGITEMPIETSKTQLDTFANSSVCNEITEKSHPQPGSLNQANIDQIEHMDNQQEMENPLRTECSVSAPLSISNKIENIENRCHFDVSPLNETQELSPKFMNKKAPEVNDSLNFLQPGHDYIPNNTTYRTEQERLEEMIVKRPHQSLRSKLSEEISTLHKVGSYSGAVKGLVKRDIMPANRIASLKPGTLFDLMSEVKPRQTAKRNNRPISLHNSELSVHPSHPPKSKGSNEIISNLSEKDLNNIIGALNPQGTAQPTNVTNTNIIIPNQSGQTPWNVSGNNQQINVHTQSVVINNINITPTEYNNTVNNSVNHMGSFLNQSWPSAPLHSADMRTNKDPRRDPLNLGNLDTRKDSPSQGGCIDPRRDLLHQSSSVDPRSHRLNKINLDPRRDRFNQGNIDHQTDPLNVANISNNYGIPPSTPSDPFDNTPYSTPRAPFNSNEGEHITPSYKPSMLKSDPFSSPGHDSSNTSDHHRPDSYILSKQEDLPSNINYSPYNKSQNINPTFLGNTPMMGTPQSLGTATSLLGNQHTLHVNSPSLLGNSHSLITAYSGYDGIPNRPPLHGNSRVDQHDQYRSFHEHLRMPQNRSVRNSDLTYGAWKERRERELQYERSFGKDQDSSTFYDRSHGDRRDAGVYGWNRDTSNYSSHNNSYRDQNRTYIDNLNIPPRLGLKETEGLQGLSPRDPRRRSIEESAEHKDEQHISSSDVECKSRKKDAIPHSRDPRIRGKSSQREGNKSPAREGDRGRSPGRNQGKSRARTRSPPRDRGRSRERYSSRRSSNHDRSPYRKSDSSRKSSRERRNSNDSYTSPLDKLYGKTSSPKTGLGYGFQKFKIPKLIKPTNDKPNNKANELNIDAMKTVDSSQNKDICQEHENHETQSLDLVSEKASHGESTNVETDSFKHSKSHTKGDDFENKVLKALDHNNGKIENKLNKRNQKANNKTGTNIQHSEVCSDKPVCSENILCIINNNEKMQSDKNSEQQTKKGHTKEKQVSTDYKTEVENDPALDFSKEITNDKSNINEVKYSKIHENEVNLDKCSSTIDEHCEESKIVENSHFRDNFNVLDVAGEINSQHANLLKLTSKSHLDSNEAPLRRSSRLNKNCESNDEKSLDNKEAFLEKEITSPSCSSSPQVKTNASDQEETPINPCVLSDCVQPLNENPIDSDSSSTLCVKSKNLLIENGKEPDIEKVSISNTLSLIMSNDNAGPNQEVCELLGSTNFEEHAVIDLSVKKLESPVINDVSFIRKCINNPAIINNIQVPIESCHSKEHTNVTTDLPDDSLVKHISKDQSVDPLHNDKPAHTQIELEAPDKNTSIIYESAQTQKEELHVPEKSTPIKETEQLKNNNIQVLFKNLFETLGVSRDQISKVVSELIADYQPTRNSVENDLLGEIHNQNQTNQCFQVSSSDNSEEKDEHDKIPSVVDPAAVGNENKVDTSVSLLNGEVDIANNKKNTLAKKKVGRKKKNVNIKAQTSVSTDVVPVKKCLPPRSNQRKHKNELEKLQEYISGYHDSDAIVAAAGPRSCRLQKEQKPSTLQLQVSSKNRTAFQDQSGSENSAGANGDSDSSDADLHQFTEKLKKKLSYLKPDEVSCKKDIHKKHASESQSSPNKPKHPPEGLKKDDITKDYNHTLKTNTSSVPLLDSNETETPIATNLHGTTMFNKKEDNTTNEIHKDMLVFAEVEKPKEAEIADECHPTNNNKQSLDGDTDDGLDSQITDGPKKPKKKNLWKSGRIIKKKYKQKKGETGGFDVAVASGSLDVFEFDDEEKLSDLSYFQEGEMKVFKCKLCSFSGKTIVTHYAISHPKDDVLISRMCPKTASDAIHESKVFFSLKEDIQLKFKVFKCRICYHEFPRFSSFFEHIAVHTGEYRHECVKCGYRTSTKSGILKHTLSHGSKNVSSKLSCRVLYKEPVNQSVFCGYLCLICNFFQISQSNVKRHMENTHDDQDYEKIFKINLSKLNFDGIDMSENADLQNSSEENVSTVVIENKPSEIVSIPDQVDKTTGDIDQVKVDDVDVVNSAAAQQAEILHDTSHISIPSGDNVELLSSENDTNEESQEIPHGDIINKKDSLKIVKGCFKPSSKFENHVEFIEAKVISRYKKRSSIAVEELRKGKSRGFKLDVIEELLSKQSQIGTDENTTSFEEFIAKCTSNKKVTEQSEHAPDKSNDAVTRRQLPERSCKVKTGVDVDLESDAAHEDGLAELFINIGDTNDKIEDLVEDSVFIRSVETLNHRSSAPTLFENQVKRCQEKLALPQQSYEPRVVMYESSLPKTSNLSEFTHIMKQLSLVELKQVESNGNCVGSLRVAFQNGALMFFCSVKTFNIVCGFESSSLEEFGHHVNIMHHNTYWDAVCTACFCVFVCNEESHDKSEINTQSRAFCHLVREHLTFVKKSSLTVKAAQQTKEGEETPKPKLRVRRLSGDKLSTPAPDLPPNVAEPTENISSSKLCLQLDGDMMRSQSVAGISSSSYDLSSVLPTMEQSLSYNDSLTEPMEDWRCGHEYVIMNMVEKFKAEATYNEMRTPDKLRDFYKCMGETCTFTTMSSRAFASHFDHHKSTCLKDEYKTVSWNKCCYCLGVFETSREFCVHIRKVHGHSTLQCSHCFYRAANVANVHFHHTFEHPNEKFAALQCVQGEQNLPPEIDRPFTDFVLPLRCRECVMMVTYMVHTFCTHLEKFHSTLIKCHLCERRFTAITTLLGHYSREHGIGVYQCLYCTFGSGKEAGMRGHLAYKHPNRSPKAIHRTDSSGTYEPNRERLRRIMFYKDEAQLFPYIIPLPLASPSESPAAQAPAETAESPRPPSADFPIIVNVGSLGPGREIIPPPPSAGPIYSEVSELPALSAPPALLDLPAQPAEPVQPAQPAQPASDPDLPDPNYFKCGNQGCTFESASSSSLRSHLVICDYARQSQRLVCVHCRRLFKQPVKLIEHLHTHGPQRYSCAICGYKGSIVSRVSSHMKTAHHISSTTVLPTNSFATDKDKDEFIVTPRKQRGSKPGRKSNLAKTKFLPHELGDIPSAAIFRQSLGCGLCAYETKVRSNLIRHIAQHSTGGSVASEEVVNPVPEKTEKMFDKMSCLAGSSHKKRTDEGDQPAEPSLYKYVPDTVRYQCHLPDCGYRSISETMLREHIIILHKDNTSYICPHCDVVDDQRPTIPIDQMGIHLKLHDCPLFRCCHCQFYSHLRRSIEGHQYKMHKGEPTGVVVVRGLKPDVTQLPPGEPKAATSSPANDQGEEWYVCLQCTFRTRKKKLMVSHGQSSHQMGKPFKCSACNYESLTDTIFDTHFQTYHSDIKDCHVVSLFKKVVEHKKPVMLSIPPLWNRDMKRIRHIRGIRLDEKGDAPPPVATCVNRDLKDLDILELKFGAFCPPAGAGLFQCPRCPAFQARSRQDMREHLYRDLEYKPLTCKICELAGTQKTKIMKHVNKAHYIELSRCADFIDTNINEQLEGWVEKNLVGQQELMKDMPVEAVRKRRRLSTDPGQEGKPAEDGGSAPPSLTLSPSPAPSTSSLLTMPALSPISALSAPLTASSKMLSTSCSSIHTVSSVTSNSSSASVENSDFSYQPNETSGDESDDEWVQVKRKLRGPGSRQRFMCEYCKVTTKQRAAMNLHSERIHPGLPPKVVELLQSPDNDKTEAFSCQHCKCVAVSVDSLRYHWTLVHKQSFLSFLYKITEIQSELEYECVWCKRRDSVDALARHVKTSHPQHKFLINPVTVPKYKCSECDMIYNSVEILRRHFNIDHASLPFKFITIDTPKTYVPPEKKPGSDDASKARNTFKCFSCHFVSSLFVPMVKHVQRHFVTFGCNGCSNVFATSFGMRRHMTGQHPGLEPRPVMLKGSDDDLYQAKRKIIVVSESGKKRMITEEEVLLAEKEERLADKIREDTSKPSLEEKPPGKMTARKSTGSPWKKELMLPLVPAPHESLFSKTRRKKAKCNNVFVNFSSRGKNIRIPMQKFRRIVDVEGMIHLTPEKSQPT